MRHGKIWRKERYKGAYEKYKVDARTGDILRAAFKKRRRASPRKLEPELVIAMLKARKPA
jgi:hypothetical protein